MSWLDPIQTFRGASEGRERSPRGMTGHGVRLGLAFALSLLVAGCFQPLYGDRSVTGGDGIKTKLSAVEVSQIAAPNGTRLARVGVELRNSLIFDLTGGSGGAPSAYRLDVRLSSSQTQIIVDINTARPDIQNYGIDAVYTLTDIATGKKVVNSTTFARVSYNIPGQQQRFAGDRGLRDAEDRAAKVIVENIRSRLASYFVAGT